MAIQVNDQYTDDEEKGVCCGDCPFCIYDPLPNCKLWGWQLSECDESMYERCKECRAKIEKFQCFLLEPMARSNPMPTPRRSQKKVK